MPPDFKGWLHPGHAGASSVMRRTLMERPLRPALSARWSVRGSEPVSRPLTVLGGRLRPWRLLYSAAVPHRSAQLLYLVILGCLEGRPICELDDRNSLRPKEPGCGTL